VEACREWLLPQLAKELCARHPDSTPVLLRLHVSVAGLSKRIAVPSPLLWGYYLPLLACLYLRRRTHAHDRTLVIGFGGPAGGGKTTLCAVLRAMAQALVPLFAQDRESETQDRGSGTPAIPPQEISAVFCPVPTRGPCGVQALSMDAYHHRNACLDATKLRGAKGRIDTMDAAAFAADLGAVLAMGAAGATAGAQSMGGCCCACHVPSLREPRRVFLPEYDRREHEPVPNRICFNQADDGILLVEGLYLSAAAAAPPCPAPVTPEGGPIRVDWAAWLAVRKSIDVLFFIDTPMALCRMRAVERKAGGGAITRAQAEVYYDTVDAPTFRWLEAQREAVSEAGGPDAVLDVWSTMALSGALASGTEPTPSSADEIFAVIKVTVLSEAVYQ
jgi:pantothenate kinase